MICFGLEYFIPQLALRVLKRLKARNAERERYSTCYDYTKVAHSALILYYNHYTSNSNSFTMIINDLSHISIT